MAKWLYLHMLFPFVKYQGTGNDFVLMDNRTGHFPIDNHQVIAQICHRNFGVGSDGFILIESSDTADFFMRYFNADGHEGSLCGNGSRCAIQYAKTLGIVSAKVVFEASDGIHQAHFVGDEVALSLHPLTHWELRETAIFMDTGSPHHILFVDDLSAVDVPKLGASIAHGAPYFSDGTNVNFVSLIDANTIEVRTFERGVEAETLSCGTGVTAAAIATHISARTRSTSLVIQTRGGLLNVSFSPTEKGYKDIVLQGPANYVYKGNWEYI